MESAFPDSVLYPIKVGKPRGRRWPVKSDVLVSVVIPARNEYPHIYYTLHSVWLALKIFPPNSCEVLVVDNSDDEKIAEWTKNTVENLGVKCIRCDVQSNHVARNMGVKAAAGKYCLLMDAHVLLRENFVSECLKVLEDHPNVGIVHAPFTFKGFEGIFPHCFYNLVKFYLNMHGSFSQFGALWDEHYPVVLSPHSAYAFRTKEWLANGGYLNCAMNMGGGEPLVTFKYWMFGQQVHLTPLTLHVHFRHRSYHKSRREWKKNFAMTAYALGGPKWGEHYLNALGVSKLLKEFPEGVVNHWEFVKSCRKYSFEELPDLWVAKGARPCVNGRGYPVGNPFPKGV
jgi:glycosyltransferase involved in cell wall biosynthesis